VGRVQAYYSVVALLYINQQTKRQTKGSARLLANVRIEARRAFQRWRAFRSGLRFQNPRTKRLLLDSVVDENRALDLARLVLLRWHERHLAEPFQVEEPAIRSTRREKKNPKKIRTRRGGRGRRCTLAQDEAGVWQVVEYQEPEPRETVYHPKNPTDLDFPRPEHEIREDAKPPDGEVFDLFPAPTRRATPDGPLPSLDEPDYRQLRINLFRFLFGSKADCFRRLADDPALQSRSKADREPEDEDDGGDWSIERAETRVATSERRVAVRISRWSNAPNFILEALVGHHEVAEDAAVEALPLAQRKALRRRLVGEEWSTIRKALRYADDQAVMKAVRKGRERVDGLNLAPSRDRDLWSVYMGCCLFIPARRMKRSQPHNQHAFEGGLSTWTTPAFLRREALPGAVGGLWPVLVPIVSRLDRIAVEFPLPVPLPGERLDRAAWKKAMVKRGAARARASRRAISELAKESFAETNPNGLAAEGLISRRSVAIRRRRIDWGRYRIAGFEYVLRALGVVPMPWAEINAIAKWTDLADWKTCLLADGTIGTHPWWKKERAFYPRRPWRFRLVEVLGRGVRRLVETT
jgi:hypothetical protein